MLMWNCTSQSMRRALEVAQWTCGAESKEEGNSKVAKLFWWAGGDLNSRPYGPHVRVSACKADVLSGESMLLTRLNYRPRPKTRKPRPSRLRFRGSVKSSSDGLSLWLIDLTCLHRLCGFRVAFSGSRSSTIASPGGPL